MSEQGVSLEFFAGACKLLARSFGNRLMDVSTANAIKDHFADIEALYKTLEMVPRRKPGHKGKNAYYCTCWDRDAWVEPIGGDAVKDKSVRRGRSDGPLHERGSEKCWVGKEKK
jgi:hypothetical protein